ncbi:cellobiose phosphorylase [Saccharibacillus sp. O23]|uniref:cellobiose phosphorylase n=1 Tax=Saccharibacillus sp. O23 TaxID=2009338 RepID=UPI000B4E1746|nr:cellobiose phosphorylase [Saccharibacillus sp. O23]OWR28502.1 cellobiose phosphorylase [Saccharibacillus sp. O23]
MNRTETKIEQSRYSFDEQGRFVIDDYEQAKPFASFLPGIAGLRGIPMWAFYVNRGQGIASFGVEDKNSSIMEFFPADRSYSLTPLHGFRTFVKKRPAGAGDWAFHELFPPIDAPEDEHRRMFVSRNKLELESVDPAAGLRMSVRYFTLPGERYAALVRQVELTNLDGAPVELEVLDGMPALLPYGIDNGAYKELGYTLKSWMDVEQLESRVPFYRLRGSTADSSEVGLIEAGHFMYSFLSQGGTDTLLSPIVDTSLIFGTNASRIRPDGFRQHTLEELLAAKQVTTNKVPGAFSGYTVELGSGETVRHCMVIGHVPDIAIVQQRIGEIATTGYIEAKAAEAEQLADRLTDDVATVSGMPLLDAYVRQSYLDNLLRGGYPLLLPSGAETPHVYHVYSRKHGDLERDYNFFKLQAKPYSQGNGNFRDANQNRRSDVWFNPGVGTFNIRMFMSLIQADGYNPLVVKGSTFRFADEAAADKLLKLLKPEGHEAFAGFRRKAADAFTPGELVEWIQNHAEHLLTDEETFAAEALSLAKQDFDADFGEGYWTDHWTYNLDLIESYLAIFPDRLRELMSERDYRYYDSPAWVEPRSRKYVKLPDGRVRQYHALAESPDKEAQLHARTRDVHWMRTNNGEGEIYTSNLLEKLLSLATIKLATLDPSGVGIEMEAGKPGWNDSMNGLPGLMASGFGELCELLRLVEFLQQALAKLPEDTHLRWPSEMQTLLERVSEALADYEAETAGDNAADGGAAKATGSGETDAVRAAAAGRVRDAATEPSESGTFAVSEADHRLWDKLATAREQYREAIRFGFAGEERTLSAIAAAAFLEAARRKLADGMDRALEAGGGLYPTYFTYEAAAYSLTQDADGAEIVDVQTWNRVNVPHFLEGVARAMKVHSTPIPASELYDRVRGSGLYDRKLGMYKVNESLDGQPFELGRTRAFTPGWLENESVFMHMEFKYLLECLRSGQYEKFYDDLRQALPPFMDADVYGRSTLENSSFIASSANPDESLHGTGFIARLSGSTAEFIHMWLHMMTGGEPFGLHGESGTLSFALRPKLPEWLFTPEGKLSFRLLRGCEVTYVQDVASGGPRATYGEGMLPKRYVLWDADGACRSHDVPTLGEVEALAIREGRVVRMDVYL